MDACWAASCRYRCAQYVTGRAANGAGEDRTVIVGVETGES
jgi:hypothetical protein